MSDGMTAFALAERDGGYCDSGNRIPTGRYPLYAESESVTIPAGELCADFDFEAQRDLLLTDLSISAELADGTAVCARVSTEYCNTKYLVSSNIRVWGYCCQRKPIFLVGVREDKHLTFQVCLCQANEADVIVTVSLSGFQGSGCCG